MAQIAADEARASINSKLAANYNRIHGVNPAWAFPPDWNGKTDGDRFGDMNLIAQSLGGVGLIADGDLWGGARGKLNSLDAKIAGLDWYADFTRPVGRRGEVVDTSSGGLVEQTDGTFVSRAANALAISDRGLLTVPSRTNLINQSFNLSASNWFNQDSPASITYPYGTSPDLTATSSRVVFPASASRRNIGNIAVTAGQSYTLSAFVKPSVAGQKVRLAFYDGVNQYNSPDYVLASGWQRITHTVTPGNTTPNSGNFQLRNSAANEAADVEVWAPQFEGGPFATPPILTSGSAATRTGNRQVVDLSGKLGLGVCGFVKANILALPNTGNCQIVNFGTNPDRLNLFYNSSGTIQFGSDAGAVGQGQVNLHVGSGQQTIVFAASPNYFAARRVGSPQQTRAANTYPSGLGQMVIGSRAVAIDPSYQSAQKIGLKFGPVDQTAFDNMYALAAAA